MRMIDDTRNAPLTSVWAYLTPHEARQLLLALTAYFGDELPDPEWHHHIANAGEGELTLAVYAPDGSNGKNAAWQEWFRSGTWEPGMFGPMGE